MARILHHMNIRLLGLAMLSAALVESTTLGHAQVTVNQTDLPQGGTTYHVSKTVARFVLGF